MALIEEFNKSGNWLFKKRSFIPVVLYVFATIVLFIDVKESIPFFATFWWGVICIAVSMFGLLIRAFTIGFTPSGTSGRNTKKQVAENINTKGIYSIVRHPLYLGNLFMWLGIILFVGNTWFYIVGLLLFWIYYERIMFAEEMFIASKFEEYTAWADKTPAFIPSFKNWQKYDLDFSLKNVLKREYNGFFAVFISFAYINTLKHFIKKQTFEIDFFWLIALIISFVIFVILRTLKKKTNILNVEGR